jgi:hypothetical protein
MVEDIQQLAGQVGCAENQKEIPKGEKNAGKEVHSCPS